MKTILIIFIFLFSVSFAQKDTLSIYYDKSKVEVRTITDSDIAKYNNDEEFNYSREVIVPENYFMKLLQEIYTYLFENGGVVGSLIKYLLIALFLGFIIVRLLGFKFNKLFYKNKVLENIIPIDENIDNIKEFDIDKIISKAKKDEDFKKAVRYNFIKLLKLLSKKEIIEWEKNKTNNDYYYEILDKELKEKFIKLAYVFAYIWYGNFNIDKINYTEYEKGFNEIFEIIDSSIKK